MSVSPSDRPREMTEGNDGVFVVFEGIDGAGTTSQADLYALEQIKTIGAAWQDAFEFIPVLSAEPADSSWAGKRGMVTDFIQSSLPGIDWTQAEGYMCGPPGMIDAAMDVMTGLELVERLREHAPEAARRLGHRAVDGNGARMGRGPRRGSGADGGHGRTATGAYARAVGLLRTHSGRPTLSCRVA